MGACLPRTVSEPLESLKGPQRSWVVEVPAPVFAPVRKRATGKMKAVNPFMNSNDRLHRMTEATMTAAWRAAGAQAAAGLAPIPCYVRVWGYVYKPVANRYDPQNLYPTAKAIVDGFRDAGLFVDDDWRNLEGPFMLHGGKGPARVVLHIEETTRQNNPTHTG